MTSLWQTRFFRENALPAVLFLAVVHLFYGKTVRAGFVTDFTGLLERLDGAPFRDFLTCFGFPAMHQITNFFLYFFVKCFDTNALPWYLIFTTLHVANGFLGFLLAKKILLKCGFEAPAFPALAAALLFLLSPYQADAVVWKVCFNFLCCTLLMLGALLFLIKYLEEQRLRHLFFSHGLFLVALFTFELAVVFPFLAAVVFLLFRPSPARGIGPGIFLPHLLLLVLYFSLNKLLLGGWVGHYGEGVHLNFNIRVIAANLLKYFSKYLFFWREMPHGHREALLSFFEKPAVAYSGLMLGSLLLGFGIYFFKKISPNLKAAGVAWLLFFLALLPVSNLYVAWVLQGENDRYGYFASLFFFIGAIALLQFLHRYIRFGLLLVWLMISVFYLNKITAGWQNSAHIVEGLLNDFRWPDAPEVYVLAFPENYEGLPMFKDFSRQDLALKHALKYLAGKKSNGKFYQVAQFNMTSPTDGVSVVIDSTGVFHPQFNQWGNWWWRNGIGTSDYETEQYRFKVEGNGSRVELKKPPAQGAIFIYVVGEKWMETTR